MTSLIHHIAAALAAAGLALAQQTPSVPAPAGVALPAGQAVRIGVALGLTAEQRVQVQNILDTESSQLQPLLPQERQNHRAIRQLIESGTTGEAFDTQLKALADTQGSLVSQMTAIRARASAQIWALLTPDQRQRAALMPGLLDPEDHEGRGAGPPRYRMRPGPPTQAQ